MSDYRAAWSRWENGQSDDCVGGEPSSAPIAPSQAFREAEDKAWRRRAHAEYMRAWRRAERAEREREREEVEALRARLAALDGRS